MIGRHFKELPGSFCRARIRNADLAPGRIDQRLPNAGSGPPGAGCVFVNGSGASSRHDRAVLAHAQTDIML